MGAGLSGLACAITLEQNRIYPTIFEKRNEVGDRFIYNELMLSIINRPVTDSLAYFSEKHGIYLHPVSNVSKLIVHSENEQAKITGKLGFTNARGRHKDAFEKQMAKQIKSKIIFNSKYTYEQLQREFTHVIIATGDAAYTAKVQDFQEDLTVTLKGATVVGKFDPHTTAAWLDNRLCPKGYGYLLPYSHQEANIVLAYPDYPENRKKDLNTLWDRFYNKVCTDLGQNLKIRDNFEVTRYIIGLCKYPRIGNTFFVGNCFGAILPFLGFGQYVSILTGIYAAYDLCGIGDYEKLTKPLQKNYNNSLVLRRYLEQLDNSKLDKIVKKLNGPIGNKLFSSKHYDPLKLVSYLLRPFVKNNTRKV